LLTETKETIGHCSAAMKTSGDATLAWSGTKQRERERERERERVSTKDYATEASSI